MWKYFLLSLSFFIPSSLGVWSPSENSISSSRERICYANAILGGPAMPLGDVWAAMLLFCNEVMNGGPGMDPNPGLYNGIWFQWQGAPSAGNCWYEFTSLIQFCR